MYDNKLLYAFEAHLQLCELAVKFTLCLSAWMHATTLES